MESNFDFNKIGKRMPYTTPDGFFDSLETDILKRSKTKKPQERNHHAIVAGCRGMHCVGYFVLGNLRQAASGHRECRQGIRQPKRADQDYLLNVYADDVFINNEVSN